MKITALKRGKDKKKQTDDWIEKARRKDNQTRNDINRKKQINRNTGEKTDRQIENKSTTNRGDSGRCIVADGPLSEGVAFYILMCGSARQLRCSRVVCVPSYGLRHSHTSLCV